MTAFAFNVLGADRVISHLASLPGKLDDAERRATERGGLHMVAAWKEKARTVLHKRTGGYAKSITKGPVERRTFEGWETGQGARWQVRVGIYENAVAEKYARIHEYGSAGLPGGVIRPKEGRKLLAIPTSKTKAGVARDSSPRDYKDGFWTTLGDVASKKDMLFFVVPRGAGPNATLDVLFLGVPSVKIPARRPMGLAKEAIQPKVQEEYAALVKQVSQKWARGG